MSRPGRSLPPVPIVQEAGWAPGPVRKILPPPYATWPINDKCLYHRLESKLPVIDQHNNKCHPLQYMRCINYNNTEKF